MNRMSTLSSRRNPQSGVRTVATTLCPQKCCQGAFLPLPSESCKWEWFGAGRHFNLMRLDGVTQGLRHQTFFDLLVTVSHPVSICDELLQATLRVDVQRDSFMFSVTRRGHHHPHRSVKAWSGALLLATSLNVGPLAQT